MSNEARAMLAQRMKERGLNQTKLAAMVDRTPSSVCRWLEDERPTIPDATAMVALEVLLGIPLSLWLSPEQREGIASLKPTGTGEG